MQRTLCSNGRCQSPEISILALEELYAVAGYLEPGSLPELRPYLRTKYGLTDQQAGHIEGYLQALRDTNQPPVKEGQPD